MCPNLILGAGFVLLLPYRLIVLGFALLCFSLRLIFPSISLLLQASFHTFNITVHQPNYPLVPPLWHRPWKWDSWLLPQPPAHLLFPVQRLWMWSPEEHLSSQLPGLRYCSCMAEDWNVLFSSRFLPHLLMLQFFLPISSCLVKKKNQTTLFYYDHHYCYYYY